MRNVCGLDVHKDSVFLCILKADGEKIEEKFGVLPLALIGFVIYSFSIVWVKWLWRVLVFIGFLSGVFSILTLM